MTARPLPETQRLRTRLAAALGVSVFLVAGLAFALLFFQFRGRERAAARQALLDQARLAALQVKAALPDGSPALAESLQRVLDAGSGLQRGAVLQVEGGELSLLASVDRTPTEGPENSFLFASLDLLARLQALQEPYTEEAFRSSPTGAWLAAYVPLESPSGEGPALLALGQEASTLLARENDLLTRLLLILGALTLFMALLGWYAGTRISQPLHTLIQGIDQLVSGDLTFRIPTTGTGELPNVSRALNRMAERLQEFMVGEQEKGLRSERRRAHLAATLQTVQAAAAAAVPGREPAQAEQEILRQVLSAFRLNRAAIYRLEEGGGWARLSAWAGVPGEEAAQPPERVRAGEGLVGRCLQSGPAGEAETAAAARAETGDGAAEAALPLQAGGRPLGALWLRAADRDALTEEKLTNLQSLASILALLLQHLEHPAPQKQPASLSGLSLPAGSGPAGRLPARRPLVYRAASPRPYHPPVNGSGPAQAGGEEPPTALSLPIQLRGRTIGAIDLVKPAGAGEWSAPEQELVSKLLEQLTAALESARLYEETQRRAEQERLAGEIIGKIRAGTNPEAILRTATEELRRALKATRAQVHLHPSSPSGGGPVSDNGFDSESDQTRGEK